MDKTETKEMEGEKCDCGGSIIMFNADIDTCNKCWKQYDPRPKRDLLKENQSLRSELQRVKNDLDDALDVKNGKGPTALSRLSNELQKSKELNGELVKELNNILENCDHHPRVEELLEELIKKYES